MHVELTAAVEGDGDFVRWGEEAGGEKTHSAHGGHERCLLASEGDALSVELGPETRAATEQEVHSTFGGMVSEAMAAQKRARLRAFRKKA